MDTTKIKQFPLLTTKSRSFPHSLAERVVYSYLAYQDRIEQSASIRKIASETGLNGRTVGRALSALNALVRLDGNRWIALEPTAEGKEWFAPRTVENRKNSAKNRKHWSDSLGSMKFLLPRKGARIEGKRFTTSHAAVYSMIVSLAGKTDCIEDTSAAHLSALLSRINEQTVGRSLGLLECAGLIDVFVDGARLNVRLRPLTDAHFLLFAAAEPKLTEGNSEGASEWVRPEYIKPLYDDMYDYSIRHGIPGELAHEITKTASHIGSIDFQWFSIILDTAYAEHRANRLKGKFNNPHCGYLMLFKLNECIMVQQAAYASSIKDEPEPQRESRPATEEEKAASVQAKLQQREAIAADPLHPKRREFTALDITRRVGIERVKATGVLDEVSRFLSEQHKRTGADFMAACDFSLEMTPKIIGHALHTLNHYYQQDVKATLDEFHEAINVALQKFEFEPMFERPPPPLPELDDKLDELWIESLLRESALVEPMAPTQPILKVCDTENEVPMSPESIDQDPLNELR